MFTYRTEKALRAEFNKEDLSGRRGKVEGGGGGVILTSRLKYLSVFLFEDPNIRWMDISWYHVLFSHGLVTSLWQSHLMLNTWHKQQKQQQQQQQQQ